MCIQLNYILLLDYLRDGRAKEARECFQRSVDITPEMAREGIKLNVAVLVGI